MSKPTVHFNTRLLCDEMEQRGITLKILANECVRAYLGKHREYLDGTDLSVMSAPLRQLLDDKWKTKVLLKDLGFRVTQGRSFEPTDIDQAVAYAKSLGFPVVLKPTHSSHGYGVAMHIDSPEECEEEFLRITKMTHSQCDLIVEEQSQGQDYRLTVTRDGFFAAVFRCPPSVTGDGKKTLQQLIDDVNEQRLSHRTTCLCDIWMDPEARRYLTKKGLTLKSIPAAGENVFVRSNANVTMGADCIDVTDSVHPYFIDLAFRILHSIDGLPYAGIDLMTRDCSKKGPYVILEVNPAPGISLHTHPGEGIARPLPAALIDLIFPETKRGNQPKKNRR